MKLYQCLFFLLFSIGSQANLSAQIIATINDPDGYTNLRKGPHIKADITGKVLENEIFLLEEGSDSQTGWLALFEPNGGFIHSTRVVMIEKLPSLSSDIAGDKISFNGPETTITIRRQSFIAEDHQLSRTPSGFIEAIDGGPVHGEDGGMPSNELAEMTIEVHEKTISLPQDALKYVYEIDFQSTRVYSDQKGKLFIVMHNSDGAGSYSVVWTIADGVYQGRKVLILF